MMYFTYINKVSGSLTVRGVCSLIVVTALILLIRQQWAIPLSNKYPPMDQREQPRMQEAVSLDTNSAKNRSHEFVLHLQRQLEEATAKAETTPCSVIEARKHNFLPCVNNSCPEKIPDSAELRVLHLQAERMRVSQEQLNNILRISNGVEKRKFMFLTAASSNHYQESQALIFNLKKFVFNKLNSTEFTFVYINLGLNPTEKRRVIKNCNCTVIDMPFEIFPEHVKQLLCYAWKPLIVKSMLPKAEILFYMDSSIRFKETSNISAIATLLKHRGALFQQEGWAIPNHTLRPMFDFYGDMPCIYSAFPEIYATYLFFHNQPFIDKLVLEPWVTCALNQSCICPVAPLSVLWCHHRTTQVGECHRFDQSSISIIFQKLYREKISYLHINELGPDIRKEEKMDFFKD